MQGGRDATGMRQGGDGDATDWHWELGAGNLQLGTYSWELGDGKNITGKGNAKVQMKISKFSNFPKTNVRYTLFFANIWSWELTAGNLVMGITLRAS